MNQLPNLPQFVSLIKIDSAAVLNSSQSILATFVGSFITFPTQSSTRNQSTKLPKPSTIQTIPTGYIDSEKALKFSWYSISKV